MSPTDGQRAAYQPALFPLEMGLVYTRFRRHMGWSDDDIHDDLRGGRPDSAPPHWPVGDAKSLEAIRARLALEPPSEA